MRHEIEVSCPQCFKKVVLPITHGNKKELVDRIEFLEQQLFDLNKHNVKLRMMVRGDFI